MKEKLPDYKLNTTIKVFEFFSPKKRKTIDSFLKYCEITSAHIPTQKKIRRKIIIFSDIVEKDLDKINLKDLRLFLAVLKGSSKSKDYKADMLKQIKRFLTWKYEDYPKRFSKFEDITRFHRGNKKKRIEIDDLFSTDEINFIIKSIDSLKYKTLIAVFGESGARPEEILNLVWGKVNFDKRKINVFSNKTGKGRPIPLDDSLSHLKRFKEEGFINPTNDTIIFSGKMDKNKAMSSQAVNEYFSRIEKNLKLSKRFYPYILRHSRLNQLRKVLSPDAYESISGHSLAVAMEFYKHLDEEGVVDEMNERVFKAKGLGNEKEHELEIKIENQNKEIQEIKKMLQDYRFFVKHGELDEKNLLNI